MKPYPPMSAREYCKALDFYDMPNTQFCKLIGIGWRQGIRYKNDQTEIPVPVAKLIRTAVRNNLDPESIG